MTNLVSQYGIFIFILFVLVVITVLRALIVTTLSSYIHKIDLVPQWFSVRKHFYPTVWFFLFFITSRFITPNFLDPLTIGRHFQIWSNILITIATGWLATKIVTFLRVVIINKIKTDSKNNIQQRKIRTQLDFIERFAIIAIVIIATSFVLLNFESAKKIGTSLIASAGLAGIVIGFAAQKSLSNLISGFQLAFTQPLRIDDVVIIDGEWGIIEEITLTYIVVRIWDKRRLIVPINYLLEKPFQNWTRNSADLMTYATIYTDYSVPIDELRKELTEILKRTLLWDGEFANIQVTDATEKTVKIRALMTAKDSSDAWDLKCYVREELIKFIRNKYPDSLPKSRINADERLDDTTLN